MKVTQINDSRVPGVSDLQFSRIPYFGYIEFNVAWLKSVFLSRYVHKLFRSNVPTPKTCTFVKVGIKEGDTSAPSF
jgi:hypothetical protein